MIAVFEKIKKNSFLCFSHKNIQIKKVKIWLKILAEYVIKMYNIFFYFDSSSSSKFCRQNKNDVLHGVNLALANSF